MDITLVQNGLRCDGELQTTDLKLLSAKMAASGNNCCLLLADCDIDDGMAMAGITRLLAQHLDAGKHLTLNTPPQLLVHNLYRVGRHPHAGLTVVDMREEEAYG